MKTKVLVLGSEGMVGSRFVELNKEYFDIIAPTQSELDFLNSGSISSFLNDSPALAVINFAAFTNVVKAEMEKGDQDGLAFRLNVQSVRELAALCKSLNKYLIQISTEYVFDGSKTSGLYTEEDNPNPINWYGQTKFLGEREFLRSGCPGVVTRLSMPYRAYFEGKKDIARRFLEMLQNGQEIHGCNDVINTVTFTDDIAYGLRSIIDVRPEGIIHLAAADSTTPYDFARSIAGDFSLDKNLVKPITLEEYSKGAAAPLLKNSALGIGKFKREFGEGILHTIGESLKLFKGQIKQ